MAKQTSNIAYLRRVRQGKGKEPQEPAEKGKNPGWPNKRPDDSARHGLSAKGIPNRQLRKELKKGPRATETYKFIRHRKFAKRASIVSPEAARASVEQLEAEWDKANSKARKRKILETCELAAYEARKLADDPKLGEVRQKELLETATKYEGLIERHRGHV